MSYFGQLCDHCGRVRLRDECDPNDHHCARFRPPAPMPQDGHDYPAQVGYANPAQFCYGYQAPGGAYQGQGGPMVAAQAPPRVLFAGVTVTYPGRKQASQQDDAQRKAEKEKADKEAADKAEKKARQIQRQKQKQKRRATAEAQSEAEYQAHKAKQAQREANDPAEAARLARERELGAQRLEGERMSAQEYYAAQQNQGQYGTVQQTPAQHAPAQHAPAQHAPAQHAPAQHAPAQHAPAQHAPAQHAGSQQTDLQYATAQYGAARVQTQDQPTITLLEITSSNPVVREQQNENRNRGLSYDQRRGLNMDLNRGQQARSQFEDQRDRIGNAINASGREREQAEHDARRQAAAASQFGQAGVFIEEPREMATNMAPRNMRELTPFTPIDDSRSMLDRHWRETNPELFADTTGRQGTRTDSGGGRSADPAASYGTGTRNDNRPVETLPREPGTRSNTGGDRSMGGSGYDRFEYGHGSNGGSGSRTGANNGSAGPPTQYPRGTGDDPRPVDHSAPRDQSRGRSSQSESESSRSRHTSQSRNSSVDSNIRLLPTNRAHSQSPAPGNQRRANTTDSIQSATKRMHELSVAQKQSSRASSRSYSDRVNSQDSVGSSNTNNGDPKGKKKGSLGDNCSKGWIP